MTSIATPTIKPSLSPQGKELLKKLQALMEGYELPQYHCFEHFASCQDDFDLMYEELESTEHRRLYRLAFDEVTNEITVRWMPSDVQGTAHAKMLADIRSMLRVRLGTGSLRRYQLKSGGQTLIRFPFGGAREGDSFLISPLSAPEPTLVIEAGLPESLHQLRNDAKRWIEHRGSMVNLVILIVLENAHHGNPPHIGVEFHTPVAAPVLSACIQAGTRIATRDINRSFNWSTIGPNADVTILLSEIFPPAQLEMLPPGPNSVSWNVQTINSWRHMLLDTLDPP